MKICYIASSFPRSETDYAAPWLAESAARLAAKGHSVSVFVPSHRGLRQTALGPTEVHRFRYAPAAWERLTHEDSSPEALKRSLFWKFVLVSYLVCGCFSAFFYFLFRRFDVVVVHWPFPQAAFGVIADLLGSRRLVFHFYASELLLIKDSPALKLAMRAARRASSGDIAISTYTKELVERELGPGPGLTVIPFGHTFGGRPGAAAPAAPAPGEPFRLLYAGKLIERKGPVYLVEAVRLLKDAGVPVSLRMSGDGYLKDAVLAKIKETGTEGEIELLGFLSGEAMAKELDACHALVFPSIIDSRGDTEGQGLAPLDALMHGKPVIASAVGGVVDLVRDGETGFLVPQKDPAAIAAAVRRVRDDYPAALRTVEKGRAHAAAYFGWDNVIEKFLKVYHA